MKGMNQIEQLVLIGNRKGLNLGRERVVFETLRLVGFKGGRFENDPPFV